MKKIFADMAYQRNLLKQEVKDMGKELEIVKRPSKYFWVPNEVTDVNAWLKEKGIDVPEGFKVLPKRWIVERTIAWISKYRRFSKDYEFKCSTSENLIMLAMSRNYLKNIVAAS